jgi:F-type H+-transporting ATPase subunit c
VKKILLFSVVGLVLLSLAAPVFATDDAAAATPGVAAAGSGWEKPMQYIAAGFSMAFAAALCGMAQGKAISAACEGAARNPGMADKLQLMMIIGLAFIESLVLYVMLITFVKM